MYKKVRFEIVYYTLFPVIISWIIPTEFTLVMVQWKSRLGTFLIRYHDKTSLNLNMGLRSSSDGSMAYEHKWFPYHIKGIRIIICYCPGFNLGETERFLPIHVPGTLCL